jgi:uncharacterized protein
MSAMDDAESREIIDALRSAGARFAFLHGSRAAGTADDRSDIDVAAWWGSTERPAPWHVEGLDEAVDLVVLDDAPLWLAGRIAQHGRLLFDDDPPNRVAWQADTRLRYLDELPQRLQDLKEYREAIARGRR